MSPSPGNYNCATAVREVFRRAGILTDFIPLDGRMPKLVANVGSERPFGAVRAVARVLGKLRGTSELTWVRLRPYFSNLNAFSLSGIYRKTSHFQGTNLAV